MKTQYRQQKRQSISKKPLLLIPLLLLALVAGGLFVYLRNRSNSTKETASVTTQPEGEKIDLSPPTEEDKQNVDAHKKELGAQDKPQNPAPNTTSQTVSPVITYAGQYGQDVEVAARIPGILEDGGTCKYVFSRDSLQVTKETAGLKDARDTLCTPLKVPRGEFSQAGEWVVKVTYTSSANTGTSQPVKIKLEQ